MLLIKTFNNFSFINKYLNKFVNVLNKRKFPEVIVSFTSYPPRINYLQPMLETIFNQTRKADKVVLWLAESEFPHRESDLPPYLTELAAQSKIIIEWCKDLKPHKKYFYALQKYHDSIVITVDDDLLFPPDLIECLLASYAKFPQAISAIRTHLMEQSEAEFAPYNNFTACQNLIIGEPAMNLLATNGAGSLFPPNLLNFEYFQEKLVEDICLYTDDLWLKAIEVSSGVPVVQVRKFDSLQYIESSQDIALWHENVLQGRNDADLEKIRLWADNLYGKGYFADKVFYSQYDGGLYKQLVGRNTVLYFAPHQDDELLSMGADICASVANGKDVHVVLCTDGSMSGVWKCLNNQKSCSWHKDKHTYNLSKNDFVAARDAEFKQSCTALGVKNENIHILPNRAVDGKLSVSFAEYIIRQFLKKFGRYATVCTIYYDSGDNQHKDHKALGQAAENLWQKHLVRKVRFFVEPYHLSAEQTEFKQIKTTPNTKQKIKQAIDSYSLWKPEAGRYAVGKHSVGTDLADLAENMSSYCLKKH
ncbi:MAG: PIG-L family deacetylase [Alphaproteobacteria bacterium]|nr:PIG-L family deacetylase [Alphaproteobacteria bacterium]